MTSAERDARIQAVAHLSQAHALVQCSFEALMEAGENPFRLPVDYDLLSGRLEIAADRLIEPFGVCNVLQTVEETIADGAPIIDRDDAGLATWVAGGDRGVPRARRAVVRSLVEAREAARTDEVTA